MDQQVRLEFIRLGKPVENAYIESFNGRLRDECLNVKGFRHLNDLKKQLESYREHYNRHRPHGYLNDESPNDFAARHREQIASPLKRIDTPPSLLFKGLCGEWPDPPLTSRLGCANLAYKMAKHPQ